MKEIIYDRETQDFALYLDGELVGFAGSYHAGEIMLDQLMYDQLAHAEPIQFTPSRDEAHRQERWTNILDHIDSLPEPQKTEAINFTFATLETIIGQSAQRTAA